MKTTTATLIRFVSD